VGVEGKEGQRPPSHPASPSVWAIIEAQEVGVRQRKKRQKRVKTSSGNVVEAAQLRERMPTLSSA
jgi:hypothetical protein